MKNKFAFLFLLAVALIASVQSSDSVQLLKQLEDLENLQFNQPIGYATYVDQYGRPLNAFNQIVSPYSVTRNGYGQYVNRYGQAVPVKYV